MKDNVTRLRPLTIPPSTVIDTLSENVKDIEAIYVVTIEDGRPVCYASGDLSRLCMAAVTMQDLATKYLNGEIE